MRGEILGLIGIAVALTVPLLVEWSRRPKHRIERGDDVNQHADDPPWRLVHVKVANIPLRGWRSYWLLRNAATSCRVSVTFESKSDGKKIEMAGRWGVAPEPRSLIGQPPKVPIDYLPLDPSAGLPDLQWHFDPTKVPQSLRIDLSPDSDGESVPIAIKFGGERQAFGFTSASYAHPGFRAPELELPDEHYIVTVEASAGGIRKTRRFDLHKSGQTETDLSIST